MSDSKNCKPKRKASVILAVVSVILCLAFVCSLVLLLVSGKERNPDNLITVDENYLKDTRTDYGLEVDVKDDGSIKLDGDTTVNELFEIQIVKLPAGVYTLSGIKEPNLAKMYLSANWGNGNVAYAGLESDTFVLTAETTVSILLYIEGSDGGKSNIDRANKTITPVLVKGEAAGEFYA